MPGPPADRPLLNQAQRRRRRADARARARRARLAAVSGLVTIAALAVGLVLAVTGGGESRVTSRRFSAPGQKHAPVKPAVRITVEASGDLLIHSPVWEQALADGGGTHYDFAALFKQIKPYIAHVDVPLCHMETP